MVSSGGSGDITLSYIVDGVSQSSPPDKNSYLLTGASCTNADITYDSKTWKVSIENYTGKVKCNLEFQEAQYNVVQKWLATANINKDYTTIPEVLNDTTTLQSLINNSSACDYLVNSTDWVSAITSDENAMTYVGDDDYCGDLLLNDQNWFSLITQSIYRDKILHPLVPALTSNTANIVYSSRHSNDAGGSYNPFYVFDNKNNTTWCCSESEYSAYTAFIGYNFTVPTVVNGIYMKSICNTSTVIRGSNDGVTWVDIDTANFTSAPQNGEYYWFLNNTKYQYYSVRANGNNRNDSLIGYFNIDGLQFYGRNNN